MTAAWPTVELAKLATVLSGFAFDSTKFSDDVGTPLVRIRDVSRGWSDTYFNGDYDSKFIVNDSDLLVGMDGQFNRERWRGGKALLNQRVCRVTADGKNLDQRYLYYFLPEALKQIEAETPFATVKHLSAPRLRSINVPLPPLEEQHRIADILDHADALRANGRVALGRLDELAQAIFFQLFGEPVTNSKGWPDDKVLDDVADIVSGITKGRKLNGASTREVPYLAVVNVQDRRLDLSTVRTIEATESEICRYHLQRDDLLLTEGGDPDKLGRGTLWSEQISECIHQNHIFRVRLTNDHLTPLF